MKIRTKFVLYLMIFVISVFAIVYLISVQISKNRAIENINNHINTAVKFKAHNIESMLKNYTDITKLLAVGVPFIKYFDTTIDHKTREKNLETRISNTIKVYHSITRIRILDVKGIVAASSHEDIGMDSSNSKIFLEGKKGTYIGDLHFSEFTDEYVLSISAPVYTNGKISGVLIINFDAATKLFPIIADKTGLPHSTDIYLLNKDHYLISPTPHGDKLLETKIEPEQISLCHSEHIENKIPEMDLKKQMPYINYRGEKVMGTHSYISLLKWFLIVEVNEAEFMLPVIKYRNILLITFSIILILSLGVSYIISIFLTKPIRRLEAGVQEIINGNMNYKVAIKSKDEIGQLSRVFDDMTTRLINSKRELENHAGNLEEQVKHRTAELNKQFEKSEQQRIGTLNVLNDLDKINVNLKAEITERKKIENELKDSEIRYHSLFENSSEFIFTLDLKGNFTDVNKAALALTGYTKSELLKMNFKDYTPKRDHRKLFRSLSNVYKTGKPLQNISIEAIIKDKSIKYFETSFTLLRKGKQIIGFQGSSKDITERKQAEENLKKKINELEIFNDTTVGRELKMLELKKEINELLEKSGQKPKYEIPE